jgi:hypothetical protein
MRELDSRRKCWLRWKSREGELGEMAAKEKMWKKDWSGAKEVVVAG